MNPRSASSWGLAVVLAAGPLFLVPGGAAQAAPLNDCVSSDNGDPILRSFSRTPSAVDVTGGRERIHFALQVDDLGGPGPASGLSTVWVGLGETPGLDEGLARVAELSLDDSGAWVGSIVVPRWSEPGRVRLGVLLGDGAENYRSVDPKDLAAAGFPHRVTVRSTPDTTAPELTALRLSPRRLDTRTRSRTLTVTARARDTESGVKSITVNGMTATDDLTHDPDGSIRLKRIPGTAIVRARTRVPRWVGQGTWKPYLVRVEDHAGRSARYGYRRLGRLGFDQKVRVVSRTDVERPELERFSLRPEAVDVRTANKTVTVTLRAVDHQSGVRRVEAFFWGRDYGSGPAMRRVAGTRRDGIWRGIFLVPRCTPQAGALRVRVDVTDGFGRSRSYGRASWQPRAGRAHSP